MKLTINRKEWLRGEGNDKSKLLRSTDGKRCCIGILAQTLGIEDSKIKDLSGVGQIEDPRWPEWCTEMITDADRKSQDIGLAYQFNDSQVLTDEQRETGLSEVFARNDIQVEFTDGVDLEDGPEVEIIQRERIIRLENILKDCLPFLVPGSKVYRNTVRLIGGSDA